MVMISTTGRSPTIAAPTARPTKPSSAIGVSRTRLGPNSCSSPAVILYDPSKTPISSPIKKTLSSRSSSSRSVSWSAWRYVIVGTACLPGANVGQGFIPCRGRQAAV
jgi:hypothetical protein